MLTLTCLILIALIPVLFPARSEIISLVSCAFSEKPLLYNNNKKCPYQIKYHYTRSASGNRFGNSISEMFGSTLRVLEEHLGMLNRNKKMDIKIRKKVLFTKSRPHQVKKGTIHRKRKHKENL
jgi:hypothetical protein